MTIPRTWAAATLALLPLGVSARSEETPKDPPHTVASPEGFFIESAEGDYRIHFRGYVQLDGRFYPSDDDNLGTDQFTLRRVRPIVEGTVAKYFDFTFIPDFGGGTTVIQDAYLDVHFSNKARVRAGKYKSPFSLERLQSARNLLFVERATPPSIAPNRDVGIEVWGELGGGVLWYAAGVFNGVVDGGLADGDTNDGKDLVGRVFVQPFKKGKAGVLRNLGLGVAGSTGQQAGTTVPAYKSGGQLTFFTYASGVTADGNRNRLSPQASYYGGPVTLFAEHVRSSQDLRKSATDTLRVDTSAWGVTGGVLLTGEAATSTSAGVRPRKPIDPAKGQWGALELVARVSALSVDPDAFTRGYADPAKSAQKARAYGVGINWYLNRHVKQVVGFERTTYTGGKAGGDRAAENAFFIRTQVAF